MPVSEKKRARIKAMGGKVTDASEWLDLSVEDVAIIDMKIQLGEGLRALRKKNHLSQEMAAEMLHTSQGRVSKMEKGMATLDQLARCLLMMGHSKEALARALLK